MKMRIDIDLNMKVSFSDGTVLEMDHHPKGQFEMNTLKLDDAQKMKLFVNMLAQISFSHLAIVGHEIDITKFGMGVKDAATGKIKKVAFLENADFIDLKDEFTEEEMVEQENQEKPESGLIVE